MTQIQTGDVSLKAVKLSMEYPWEDDVRLSERPMLALAAELYEYHDEKWREMRSHRGAFIGTQIDAHDDWWEDTTNHKYDRRLSWKKWFNPNSNQNPTEQYAGQVDLIDRGTYWRAKTEAMTSLGQMTALRLQ